MSAEIGYMVIVAAVSFGIGVGVGGYVGYKLVMRKIESSITGMFGGEASADSLIDNIVEVDNDES